MCALRALAGTMCLLLVSCAVHYAPPTTRVPPPVSVATAEIESSSGQIRLTDGTLLWLMVTDSVSSKTAKPGDSVKLQVVGSVKAGDLVVIANKASALGTIAGVKKPGMAWHPGHIAIRPDSVTLVDGQQAPLNSTYVVEHGIENAPSQDDVRDAMGSSGGLYLLYFPFSFLEHGEDAIVPRGDVLGVRLKGTTLLDRASLERVQPPTPRRDASTTSLTLYYPEFAPKGSVTVWCGAAVVGKLRQGRRLNLTLPPGNYWVRFKKKQPAISVEAAPGGEHYVELLYPRWGESVQVDHDLGEARSSFTKPADAKDVVDIKTLRLADLQTEPALSETQ
jgi:hypothetical protein